MMIRVVALAGAALLAAAALHQWQKRHASTRKITQETSSSAGAGAAELVEAAGAGATADVARLVAGGADVNGRHNGLSAVLCAAGEGHASTVAWLLEHGADVSASAPNGMTAVMGAAADGHARIVASLVGARADANAEDGNGVRALAYAAHGGHRETCACLLDSSADVNAVSRAGALSFPLPHARQPRSALLSGPLHAGPTPCPSRVLARCPVVTRVCASLQGRLRSWAPHWAGTCVQLPCWRSAAPI